MDVPPLEPIHFVSFSREISFNAMCTFAAEAGDTERNAQNPICDYQLKIGLLHSTKQEKANVTGIPGRRLSSRFGMWMRMWRRSEDAAAHTVAGRKKLAWVTPRSCKFV